MLAGGTCCDRRSALEYDDNRLSSRVPRLPHPHSDRRQSGEPRWPTSPYRPPLAPPLHPIPSLTLSPRSLPSFSSLVLSPHSLPSFSSLLLFPRSLPSFSSLILFPRSLPSFSSLILFPRSLPSFSSLVLFPHSLPHFPFLTFVGIFTK